MSLILEAVLAEDVEGRPGAPGAAGIERALQEGWLRLGSVEHTERVRPEWGRFGRGEVEVAELALRCGADVVIIGDRSARRMAARAGLNVIGAIGVLRAARRAGLVQAVTPLLEELRTHGFRISDEILATVGAEETGDPS